MYKIITQYSLWYVFFCFLAGLGYAYLLYSKKSVWNKKVNYFLAGLRFLLVCLLAFLLLGPLIKYFQNYIEKPTIVIALDNSESMTLTEKKETIAQLKTDLTSLKNKLEDADLEVSVQTFEKIEKEEPFLNQNFTWSTSNISSLLNNIQSSYENRNLAGIVLVSDGIVNQGVSPDYVHYNFPIHSLGVGDTLAKKDINLKNVLYNKLTYVNNKFPIVAEIHNKGFQGKTGKVSLKQGSKIIETKTIQFQSDSEVKQVEFYISSALQGMQHYVVSVEPLQGEFTYRNNVADVYVDVIENKEKILLIASAPHPDIKAIRAAVEKKENYELKVYIPGTHEYKEGNYDLIILHCLPDYAGTAKSIIDKYTSLEKPILYIVGNQTNINQFNNTNRVLSILSFQNQKDLVLPTFNSNFDRFSTETDDKTIIQNYPPLIVPYGEYTIKESVEVLMYQRIGNSTSSKPLILSTSDRKHAVIAGEGLWRWRQHEYMETQDHKAFDKYITNLIQYLSVKEDKRKFRVYPISTEFMISDPIIFETEIYRRNWKINDLRICQWRKQCTI
jgi:hypothetical protein